MKRPNVRYLLSGFTETTGVRVFAFEGVTDDWVRTAYSVTADLALARKHGIRVQELPLLCRRVLEMRSEDKDQRAFTFAEGDMTIHADRARAEIESHKKKPFAGAAKVGSASTAQAV